MTSVAQNILATETVVPAKRYEYWQYVSDYDPVVWEYYDRYHGYASNDVDRRPQPKPLWAHPTVMPTQWTAKRSAVKWKRQYWNNYGWWQKLNISYYSRMWDHDINNVEAYPDPDWATRMRLSIKDTKVNLGETLAEYRQSANMFGDFAEAAVDAWKVFKGKRIRRKVTPCTVNSAHLMTTYGLNPLANTLYDSIDELYFALGVPPKKRFFAQVRGTDTTDQNSPASGILPPFSLKQRFQTSYRARAVVTFNTFGRASAFSFGNPAQIAWELVPYSFVLDWVLPIGDYLSALDALTGCSDVIGSVSAKRKGSYEESSLPGNGCTPLRSGSGSMEMTSRTTFDSIPMPQLPKYSPSPSWHKVKNGISLILNILQPCKRGRSPSKGSYL